MGDLIGAQGCRVAEDIRGVGTDRDHRDGRARAGIAKAQRRFQCLLVVSVHEARARTLGAGLALGVSHSPPPPIARRPATAKLFTASGSRTSFTHTTIRIDPLTPLGL